MYFILKSNSEPNNKGSQVLIPSLSLSRVNTVLLSANGCGSCTHFVTSLTVHLVIREYDEMLLNITGSYVPATGR
jgi:hypothetical protein